MRRREKRWLESHAYTAKRMDEITMGHHVVSRAAWHSQNTSKSANQQQQQQEEVPYKDHKKEHSRNRKKRNRFCDAKRGSTEVHLHVAHKLCNVCHWVRSNARSERLITLHLAVVSGSRDGLKHKAKKRSGKLGGRDKTLAQ